MASSYPGAVDALVRPDGTDPLSDGHAALHNATSDAVEAVQTELGTTPSGSAATVAARFTAAESATADAQADATTALADAATADGKAVTAQATADAAVSKATYDAHSVLAATIDDTPAAVTVGEQAIVGRKTGGNITALTAAEVKTLLGVTTGDVSGLGTAAVVDVPAAGNATSGQAVKGSDTRLTDARTPTAHKTSHQSGGSDEITLAQAQVTNLTTDLSAKAPLASPTFTGVPAAPTAAVDTNTTQVATTAFTVAQIADDAVAKSAVGNLLTANQASIETDTTGFVGNTNVASMSASSAAALFGSKCLAVTSTGSDDTKIQLSSGLYTYDVAVTAGQTYTFSAYVKSAATPRSVNVLVVWRDGDGNATGTSTGAYSTTSTSDWTRVLVTGVAPAGTFKAQPIITIVSSVASEVHYFDCLGFWEGADGQWSLPGTPITNLGFYTDESVGRRLFQWDANNSRWQMTYGDTGWRAVTDLLLNGWLTSADRITIRRQNNVVTLMLGDMDGRSATTDVIMTLPSGFRPDWQYNVPSYTTSGATSSRSVNAVYTGNVTWCGTPRPTYENASFTYLTSDAWPTTLPGTAVGSIPA